MPNLHFVGAAAEAPIDPGALCLYTTWTAYEKLTTRGFQPHRLWDAITPELGTALDEWVLERAQRWYYDGEQDVTKFQGMSLGGIHEWMLWFKTFLPVYKIIAAASHWIMQEQPARIWFDEDVEPHWPAALAQVSARWAPAASVQCVASNGVPGGALRPWRPQAIHRKHYLAAQMWNAAARIARLSGTRKGCNVLYFNYHTIEPILKGLLDAPGDRFHVMMADRPPLRLLQSLLVHGVELLLPDPAPLDGAEQQKVRRMQEHWRELSRRDDFRAQFRWNGVDAWPALQNDLNYVIESELPYTAVLARGYLRALERARPDCVLLPFDSAYLQQMVIEAAQQLRIPSIVMLHGLPGTYHRGGSSSRADYLMVWGPAIANKFVQMGKSPEAVFTVGFPGYAIYHPSSRQRSAAKRTILLLTNPLGNGTALAAEDDSEIYLFYILSTLMDLPGIQLLLRPHPSESAGYYVQFLASHHFTGVRVVARESIARLLDQADLVIGPISTVLIEALAAGVPVMCVNFSKVKYPAPFDGNWDVPVISDTTALRAHMAQFLRGELPGPSQTVLEAFCGPRSKDVVAMARDTIERITKRTRD